MTHAYSESYLSDAKDRLSQFFDYLINDCGMKADWVASIFLSSGYAEQFERGNPAILAGMSGMKLPELYRVEKEGNRCLTAWNREVLKDTYVAQPRPLKAELDGEEIDGWVLLPQDYDPQKKYPAVLDIHGGPKCAYGPVFFHEMPDGLSFVGYAVILIAAVGMFYYNNFYLKCKEADS